MTLVKYQQLNQLQSKPKCSDIVMWLSGSVFLETLTVSRINNKFATFMELKGARPCSQQTEN